MIQLIFSNILHLKNIKNIISIAVKTPLNQIDINPQNAGSDA